MITVMGDKTTKISSEGQGCVSEQLNLVRRWLDELEGSNRYKAFELMQRVMTVEITNEEAFALLESK
jgi:hypothetical protein